MEYGPYADALGKIDQEYELLSGSITSVQSKLSDLVKRHGSEFIIPLYMVGDSSSITLLIQRPEQDE